MRRLLPLLLLAGCTTLGPVEVTQVPASKPPIELARCIEQQTEQNRYSDHVTQFRTIGDSVELVAKGGFPDPITEIWRVTLTPGEPASIKSQASPHYDRLVTAIEVCDT